MSRRHRAERCALGRNIDATGVLSGAVRDPGESIAMTNDTLWTGTKLV